MVKRQKVTLIWVNLFSFGRIERIDNLMPYL